MKKGRRWQQPWQRRQPPPSQPPQNIIRRILNAKNNIIAKEKEEERWRQSEGVGVGVGGGGRIYKYSYMFKDKDSSHGDGNVNVNVNVNVDGHHDNTKTTCKSAGGTSTSTNNTSRSSNYIIPSFSQPNVHFLLSPQIAKDLLYQHEYNRKKTPNEIEKQSNDNGCDYHHSNRNSNLNNNRNSNRDSNRNHDYYVALYKPTSKARSLLQHALTNANGETWDRQRYCISMAFGPRSCKPIQSIANQIAACSILQSLEDLSLLSSSADSDRGTSSQRRSRSRSKRDVSFSFARRFFQSKEAGSGSNTNTNNNSGVTVDIREIALKVAAKTMCVAVMGKKYIGVNDNGVDIDVDIDIDVDQDTYEPEGKKAISILCNMFEPTLQPKRIGMRRNYNDHNRNNTNSNGSDSGSNDFIQEQQRIEDELTLLVARAVDEFQIQRTREENKSESERECERECEHGPIDNNHCLIHNLLAYEATMTGPTIPTVATTQNSHITTNNDNADDNARTNNKTVGTSEQQLPMQQETQEEGRKDHHHQQQQQQQQGRPHKKYYLTREEVISNAHSALLAGTQTICTTITGALAHLASRNDLINEIESQLQKSTMNNNKGEDGGDSNSLSSSLSSSSSSDSCNNSSESLSTIMITSKDVVQESLRLLPPVAGLPRTPTACDLDFDHFDRAKEKECPYKNQYSSHSSSLSSPSSPRATQIRKGNEIIIDLLACAHLNDRKMIVGSDENQNNLDYSCTTFMESLQFNPKMNKGKTSFAWGMGARKCPAGLLSVECISSVIDALVQEGFRWHMVNEKQDGIAEDGVEKWLKESVSYLPTLTFDRPLLVHFERQNSAV